MLKSYVRLAPALLLVLATVVVVGALSAWLGVAHLSTTVHHTTLEANYRTGVAAV